jgi:hypothetical protein
MVLPIRPVFLFKPISSLSFPTSPAIRRGASVAFIIDGRWLTFSDSWEVRGDCQFRAARQIELVAPLHDDSTCAAACADRSTDSGALTASDCANDGTDSCADRPTLNGFSVWLFSSTVPSLSTLIVSPLAVRTFSITPAN